MPIQSRETIQMRTATTTVLKFRPIDDVESSLLESWREVSKATHRFLVLLREFDLRQGWKAYGNSDCAEWLDWKCGISRVTAQEKVRVARALWLFPGIDAAFERGELSYSKVRAITRVATAANESELLAFARSSTAAQVEAYCRRLRNGDAEASMFVAKRLHESRSLARSFREDGSGTLTVELPREDLELVMKALEFVAASLPDDPSRSMFAKGADALLQMARDALAGGESRGSAPENYQVVVHVDASALCGTGGESDLPLPTVKRLCCDGSVVSMTEDAAGQPLNVGRKQRVVSGALKKAVFARDKGCTFPGCHLTRYLDAHHVQHWADGGETSLDNLLLLCTTHHKLVHEGGFSVRHHRDGRYYFARPDGRPIEVGSSSAESVRQERPIYRASRADSEARRIAACRTHR
jgi:hypothetical protein